MAYDAVPSGIAIVPVATSAELERFIRLPMRLNAGDPHYIAPLLMERREALSPKTNPFFAHAEVQFWLAVRNGRDVGRISAQIDHLAPQPEGRTGHFGMITAEDDPAVFATLFRTAESWLRARGCDRALGPLNLSINEEVGLLVDGFDSPPMVMMPHDQPYVGGRVEEQGYAKAKDLYAYRCSVTTDLPEPVLRRVRRGLPAGVTLRTLDMKRYDAEVRTLTEILNDAWSDNWGFTPTTEAETAQLARSLKPVIDPRMTLFAEIDGEPAGFLIFLPNLNEAIADLNGRLLPLGWLKLLWRLKVRGLKTVRVPLMGVRKRLQSSRLASQLAFMMIEYIRRSAVQHYGASRAEIGWVLEDNQGMVAIADTIDSKVNREYRIYEKAL